MRAAVGVAGLLMAMMTAGGAWAGEEPVWDSLTLKNGRVITGSVTRVGRDFHVRLPLGSTTIRAQDVLRVDLEHDSVDELERMEREGYPTGTVAERVAYAKHLATLGQRSRSREAFEAVLRADPTHAEAHLALGHVLHQGVWKTFAQSMQDQGFVLHLGDWVTPAERDRRVAQARAEAKRQAALAAARAAEARRERAAERARLAAAAEARAERQREQERVALAERAARAEAQLAEARRQAATPVVVVPARRGWGSNRWGGRTSRSRNRGYNRGNQCETRPARPARPARQARQPRRPAPSRPARPTPPAPSTPVIAAPRMNKLPPGAR